MTIKNGHRAFSEKYEEGRSLFVKMISVSLQPHGRSSVMELVPGGSTIVKNKRKVNGKEEECSRNEGCLNSEQTG